RDAQSRCLQYSGPLNRHCGRCRHCALGNRVAHRKPESDIGVRRL
ncbi:uncharacterized protein METZ01_LOCUS377146, partial [marine metagenome]